MEALSDKRLVIFGCGYVGAAVARWAATAGCRVTALTRNHATAVLLRETGVATVIADLAGVAWHAQIEGAPDFALNCVSSGGGGAEAYRHSYAEGMNSLLAWARTCGPVGTLVYTSSTSVYPQGDGAVVDESMPKPPAMPAMSAISAITKTLKPPANKRAEVLVETESLLQRAGADVARRWFVLRLAGIYGPGRHRLLDQVRMGEVAGVGEHRLNLIHRDDIAAAVAAAFLAPAEIANETFNVVDDGRATKAEIVAWLAAQAGEGEPAPHFTGLPAGGRSAATPDRTISNEKIKTMLGWRPRYATFREGYASLLSR